ncbi:Protein crumbs 3 [Apiospora arundinis]|uniref:Protein crumbs 3 n=1 Tax=Apiospora arundinis TaxID=335852 RepID=A0ABR2JDQ6_9PEZI
MASDRFVLMRCLLALWAAAIAANAGAITTFHGDQRPPGVMMQDDKSGEVLYSYCNSTKDEPVWDPYNPPALNFGDDPDLKPKKNTSLAATGWTSKGVYKSSVFYQDVNGRVTNAVFFCNNQTGLYERQSLNLVVESPTAVHPDTVIGAALVSADDGYRVFYYDRDWALQVARYDPKANKWYMDGIMSPSSSRKPSSAIGLNLVPKQVVTVATPKDSQSLEIFQGLSNGSWSLATTGNLTLPAWDGAARGIDLLHDNLTLPLRSIWYIGADRRLHRIREVDKPGNWQVAPEQNETVWPLADAPNSELALTNAGSSNRMWIYYVAEGGHVVKTRTSGKDVWEPARRLDQNRFPVVPSTADTLPPSPKETSTTGGGLSRQARSAVIAAGVVAGAALLLSAGVWLACRMISVKKRRQIAKPRGDPEGGNTEQPKTPTGLQASSSSSSDFSSPIDGPVYELDLNEKLELATPQNNHELEQPVYSHEMENPVYSHELEGHGNRHELGSSNSSSSSSSRYARSVQDEKTAASVEQQVSRRSRIRHWSW